MGNHQMYSDVEANTEVMAASTHRQIQLLMDKCLQHMDTAKFCIEHKQYVNKHQSIGKAIEILHYLRLCLNFKNAEALALSEQLDALYAFIGANLLKASLKNEISFIDQARQSLVTIQSGWNEIAENN
jgi:flagellar protein FliS